LKYGIFPGMAMDGLVYFERYLKMQNNCAYLLCKRICECF